MAHQAQTPGAGEVTSIDLSFTAITVLYTNWRNETAVRRIIPGMIWFGSTEWHPERQWFLTADEPDNGKRRDFAFAGFKAWGQEAVAAALAAQPPNEGGAGAVPEGVEDRVVSAPHPHWAGQWVVGWLFSDREEGRESVRALALRAAAPTPPAGEDGGGAVLQADLRELLTILGMGDYARPQSPHEVFQEALTEIRQVKARLADVEDALKPFAAILMNGEPVGPIPRGYLDRSLTRADLKKATALMRDPAATASRWGVLP